MWPAVKLARSISLALAFLALAASPARAQKAPSDAQTAIESYLASRELRSLLAEQLSARLKGAPPDERAAIGERLGKLYVQLIGASTTEKERTAWEEKAKELIRVVPEIQSIELRTDLARTVYVKAEEIAERTRLRTATEDEKAEAIRALRGLKTQLETVGLEAARRVEQLEKQEESGKSSDKLTEDINEGRRLRSVAFYYAGWTNYYLGFLTTPEPFATDALKAFGWILSTGGGKPIGVERIPKSLLRYDHIARSAIGAGLASGLAGKDADAIRWFDAVQDDPDAPAPVKATILGRRISVLAAARRWADVERAVRLARKIAPDGRPGPDAATLDPAIARLLAIAALEADRSSGGDTISALAQIAMQDLVARAQINHILDLAARYGTQPLGDRGFIVFYVRAVQQFEKTAKSHEATGRPLSEPATDPTLVNAYRETARALDAALTQADVTQFPGERCRAIYKLAIALYRAGDIESAADRFLEASNLSTDVKFAEDALWQSIICYERAVRDGATDLDDRLEALSVIYLRSFPQTDHAANLLIRRTTKGGLPDEEAIKVLLGVAKDSSVYEESRRQAARLLHRMFRLAPEADKAFASSRFVRVGEEVLGFDRRIAMDVQGENAKIAADRLLVTARQMLDALLSVPTPDLARAEAVFTTIQNVLVFNSMNAGPAEPELMYRRLQMAAAKNDDAGATAIAQALSKADGSAGAARFADLASRLMFNRYAGEWSRLTGGAAADQEKALEAARRVIAYGNKVINQVGSTPIALSNTAVLTVHRTVARAAFDVWKSASDTGARDLVARIDRQVLAASPGVMDSLERLATVSESAGDFDTALDCYKRLSAGLDESKPEWFGARFETARILAMRDQTKAAQLLAQHKLLHPEWGPSPWGDKLKALFDQVKSALPEPVPADPAGKRSSGGGPP